MQRNIIFLTCFALVLGLCGNAAAVDVPQGETKTLSGTMEPGILKAELAPSL